MVEGALNSESPTWTSTLLGLFEMGLGTAVLVWSEEFGPIFYLMATVWAFVGAFALLSEALCQRSGFVVRRGKIHHKNKKKK